MNTLYWHDYETWGTNPAIDRPSQFAGVRTDENLEIIGEPLMIYCRPAEDILPQPHACLVTGISPQKCESEGLTEAEFIAAILRELGRPGTCGVGYNSIRFDDEVTRYTAWRNFHDPYEREWAEGNSRWDLIDLVRTCYALRPDGIEWPVTEDGKPSFRLEHLTEANGLTHAKAHDAFSDVEATIALARLIKKKQPALYAHLFELRAKAKLFATLDWSARKPLLHISSMFSALHGCAGLVLPLAPHPTNKNAIIVVDLSAPPDDLIRLDAQAVAARVFTRAEDLGDGESRIPLKQVHLNKCPVLLPPSALTQAQAARLKIDLDACEHHWRQLLRHDLADKVRDAMSANPPPPREDPEQQLYGGFTPRKDKPVMAAVRNATTAELTDGRFMFEDPRLQEMLWRYKARNYPETLTPAQRAQWFEFCQRRLGEGEPGVLSVSQLFALLEEIDANETLDKDKKIILQQLYRYGRDLARKYQLGKKCQW